MKVEKKDPEAFDIEKNKVSFTVGTASGWGENWDAAIVVVRAEIAEKKSLSEALNFMERPVKEVLLSYAQRFEFKAKAGESLSFDLDAERRVVLASVGSSSEVFDVLTLAREAWEPLFVAKAKCIGIDLRGFSQSKSAAVLADTFASAFAAKQFEAPKFTTPTPGENRIEVASGLEFLVCDVAIVDECKVAAAEGLALTLGTNCVRFLSSLPTESLTPSRYVAKVKEMAREASLQFNFHDEKALIKRKAGAFLAVMRGSEDRGGGIVCLKYQPKGKKKGTKKVALVGKGITFDTGGHNLKTDGHMLGMHMDMAGSAVALALILCAEAGNWPFEIEAYLAVAENSIGPKSYRCNEVVRASNGKSIEIIDTDAEGRMVLSDTLVLAAEAQPDLILDFATLTGSCIRALGRGYSGVYTNMRELHGDLIDAGRSSGERVWPFPIDADFGKALKSDIADIKQCRPSGGVDHIEAAYFLSQFVPEKITWVHTDLSAIENEDGLAHVPAKVTGFGVRFAARLMQSVAVRQWGLQDFRLA